MLLLLLPAGHLMLPSGERNVHMLARDMNAY
jgi:hypothetical protein